MKKTERNILIILIIAFIGLITLFGIFAFIFLQNKPDIETNKNTSSLEFSQALELSNDAKTHTTYATFYDDTGDTYYNTANIMYQNRNFQSCIDSCLKAREYYSKSGQEYRTAKALWERVEELNITELRTGIIYYIGLNDAGSNKAYDSFEACEGLESVCRLSSLGDYTTAQSYLEQANEKIRSHDYWTEVYNDYVAKIKALS